MIGICTHVISQRYAVIFIRSTHIEHFQFKGFKQLGQAFDVPPTAVLSGALLLVSYCLSHCVIEVPGTKWVEPSLLWLSVCMPTESGKTPLFMFLTKLLKRVHNRFEEDTSAKIDIACQWLLDEASFEKMGAMMAFNNNKIFGLYDELSMFLSQINIYRGRGLSESHDTATFLSLYNAKSWSRATGNCIHISLDTVEPQLFIQLGIAVCWANC